MSLKIAAIADTHYSTAAPLPDDKRRMSIADTLLLRAVHRINRFIKPDLTLILGDLVDDGAGPEGREWLERMRETIALLESRVIVIPGNHDKDVDEFYKIFPRPEDVQDIEGVRFVTFIDPEEPRYNARRTQADLKRMEHARAGFDGPIVSLQHVPAFPPGASECPFGFVNAGDVWGAFERNEYTLTISGHWHEGDDLVARGAGKAVIVPSLCEKPFAFMEIEIDGDRIETHRHELSIPRELELVDYHVHSPFAYCQENMDMALSIELGRELGLAGLTLTEHSGQLYFDRHTFWKAAFMEKGIDTKVGIDERMQAFMEQARQFSPPAYIGLEIDCDFSGNPVIKPEDLAQVQVRIGAVHWLAELMKPEPDINRAADEMIGRLSRFLGSGLHILAHPLRVFKRPIEDLPADFLPRLISLLREHGVAAEVNFHTQNTQPEFVKACVEGGVKLVFGSDSHNLYEVAEFYPHLELMRKCGYYNSLQTVMADIREGIGNRRENS